MSNVNSERKGCCGCFGIGCGGLLIVIAIICGFIFFKFGSYINGFNAILKDEAIITLMQTDGDLLDKMNALKQKGYEFNYKEENHGKLIVTKNDDPFYKFEAVGVDKIIDGFKTGNTIHLKDEEAIEFISNFKATLIKNNKEYILDGKKLKELLEKYGIDYKNISYK